MDEYEKSKWKRRAAWTIALFFAVFYLVVSLLPFLFMVMNSCKEQFEMLVKGIFELPDSLYLGSYKTVLEGNFVRYFGNSLLVLAVSIGVLLFITSCAAYPLARFRIRLCGPVYAAIVAAMSIPIHITLIPVFKLTMQMKLYDSIWALIGPYVAFGIPISVFILTGFMREISPEIEDAAQIDGCGRYRMFFHIMLPLAKPGLSTLAIYNGVHMWNEFSFAYTLTQSAVNRTLPLAVWDFKGQYSMNTPMILAVLTLTALPMVLMFLFAQDALVKGMTAGAVKG